MSALQEQLRGELGGLREAGTYKHFNVLESPQGPVVRMAERGEVIVLSSNNYLGLADHPDVVEAGIEGLREYGAGTASVRFICGTFAPHLELERELAELSETEAALSYVSCWNANEAAIPTLADERTVIISDALNHASIIDGVRLSKPERKLVYKHSDMDELRDALGSCEKGRRKLILTDGVFSMEGDLAKLPDILTLAREYGAVVLVDDSHGVGVVGATGRGVVEHFGVLGEVDVLTGTLGKALGGAAGGYVAASEEVCDLLSQRSRPQLFSNALPPTVACSARAAIRVLRQRPDLVVRLHENTRWFRGALQDAGFDPLPGEAAIIPIIVGETARAIDLSAKLLERGVFVTGFGFPVVPEGTARIRVQMSAALEPAHLERALEAFVEVGRESGLLT
ncbi:MAG TPA: glycine C-acetyltransferase [Gaiellaceae bacterium]|nr:glycine C-acetyltransferase [Gaiellaceae bacterium]